MSRPPTATADTSGALLARAFDRLRSGRGRALAWLAAAGFLALGLFVLPKVGISFDEQLRREYGERLFRYYASLGADREILGYRKADLYGGLFDLAGTGAERVFAGVPWHLARHALTLVCGAVGVLFAVRMAALLGGAGAAGVAALLVLGMPRYFGHALFNPKDLPFAAAWTAAVYFLARIAERLPRPRRLEWAGFGVALGCSLAVRIGGLILLGGLALVLVVHALRSTSLRRPGELVRTQARTALHASLAVLLAFGICYAFWPYLQSSPVEGLQRVLAANDQFDWSHDVLFAGEVSTPQAIGRSYLPTWLLISTPLATLLGVLLAAGLVTRGGRSRATPETWCALLAGGVLPVLLITIRGNPLYDGVRHLLFVLPSLAVLAALGWGSLWEHLAGRVTARRAVAVLFVALIVEPALWMARSGPYAYVYFNPLAGGLERASWRFETDYWMLSGRSMAAALDDIARGLPGEEPLFAVLNFPSRLVAPFLEPGSRVRLERPRGPADRRVYGLHSRVTPLEQVQYLERTGYRAAERIVPGQKPFWYVADAWPPKSAIAPISSDPR